MKYLLVVLSGCFLWACNGTDKASPSTPDQLKQDSLKNASLKDTANFTTLQWIDSVDQNLGKINEGQVVEISWHFKNTGNKPLYIVRVQPGCGCTVADQPKEPIAPGQEGVIKAKFNSEGHPNYQHKDVFVEANNSNKNNDVNNALHFSVDVKPK